VFGWSLFHNFHSPFYIQNSHTVFFELKQRHFTSNTHTVFFELKQHSHTVFFGWSLFHNFHSPFYIQHSHTVKWLMISSPLLIKRWQCSRWRCKLHSKDGWGFIDAMSIMIANWFMKGYTVTTSLMTVSMLWTTFRECIICEGAFSKRIMHK
jgi:hypothetical protein